MRQNHNKIQQRKIFHFSSEKLNITGFFSRFCNITTGVDCEGEILRPILKKPEALIRFVGIGRRSRNMSFRGRIQLKLNLPIF